jgi:NAD-dependent SIR2 family protein deacetylase|tara:strand:+ start:400 stop:735 length:336 start_codon:yes stop_codon:yes gene_type:complete
MTYASGKFALGECDRCGWAYKLHELKKEWTGFKVCPTCYEPKAPQLGPFPHVDDPQALFNPRPSMDKPSAKGVVRTYAVNTMYSVTDDPIGYAFDGLEAEGEVGTVLAGGD